MATGMFENDAAGIHLQQSPDVGSSPASIPLPDSPPPETIHDAQTVDHHPLEKGEPGEDENDVDSQRNSSNYHNNFPTNNSRGGGGRGGTRSARSSRKSNSKPRRIEEYDPSEPLTSSDEEEHSIQLIEGDKNLEFVGRGNSDTNSSNNNVIPLARNPPSSPPPTTPLKQVSTSGCRLNSPPYSEGNTVGNSVTNYSNCGSVPSSSSEEKRRPVIHFSIPTRHRLLPISTLIKRQKGGLRKDGKGIDGGIGGSLDGSKDKLQDGEEDDDEGEEVPKISLVAEIFGDDEDEEEYENKTEGTTATANESLGKGQEENQGESGGAADSSLQGESADKNNQLVDSGRWKLVDNELNVPLPPNESEAALSNKESEVSSELGGEMGAQEDGDNPTGSTPPPLEDEPEIIEIVTINVPQNNRMRGMRRRPFLSRYGFENCGEPEVIDIDMDNNEEGEAAEVSPEVTNVSNIQIAALSPPISSAPVQELQSSGSVVASSSSSRHHESERQSRRSFSVERERERPQFKRPHSSSSSNCEEGEIVDQINPNKKRKKDKKNKKGKRRKRSKDSLSPPPKSSEKRNSDMSNSVASGKEDSESRGNAVSWRKPSKRTQNRNYRDGKPKADDNFFRERETEEKQRSSSPAHRRNRGSLRTKEKSPNRGEKVVGKHGRREDLNVRNRSASTSPVEFNETESRSRSNGRGHRGRHRNRNRSRSYSSSDRSRSLSRSRRRSAARRRYRRSTSRHRHGDSRSPSYITELIRSRSSNFSRLSRSRSKSREKHRGRHRKVSVSRSRSHSPKIQGGGHSKVRKADFNDRQQKKKQLKEKEKHNLMEETLSEAKEKRKERERLREKEKRKKKEKPPEEDKKEPKEKVKEKEKKKKKKRREKSPTPVKAIVADGDSIVVSLSFAKGKTSTSNAQSRASTEDHSNDDHHHHHNSSGTASENAESSNNQHPTGKSIKDGDRGTVSSEEGAHHDQNSPVKSVADDNDGATGTDVNAATESGGGRGKKSEEKETETSKVTSSGGGSCGSRSPFEMEQSCSAVAADSTKSINPQQLEQYESSFSHSRRSSMSPTDVESNLQGDSLVTSTGDTMDLPPLLGDEDSSKMSSTPANTADCAKIFSGLSHKTNVNLSPRFQGVVQTSSSCAIAESSSSGTPSGSQTTGSSSSSGGSSQNNLASTSTSHRPLIGNIPGLYPSSAIINSSGAAPVPPPIVIPTPPPPQGVRFTGSGSSSSTASMLNPNVLASVASALLAVRQNQPNLTGNMGHSLGGGGGTSLSDNSNSMQLRHMNVLGPKSQNFALQSNQRNSGAGGSSGYLQGSQGGGGDSPMSPNSSEGDDLFEPPTERGGGMDKGVNGGGNKMGNNSQHFAGGTIPQANSNDNFNPPGHPSNKERKSLFDSLFDPPGDGNKKATPVKQDNKPMKTAKPKFRKGAPKKETIKVNTSGGLTKGELRLTDEVPTSAVELIVKQKYLKKLNRQERVVEEVKLSLKPHYSKRHVNKDEYKEILRRAVPKICHNKTGEINPGKIKELVEAYVKKFRHARKRGLDMSSIK